MLLTVPDQSLRGGYMLCFLDDGQGMSPGTNPCSFAVRFSLVKLALVLLVTLQKIIPF